jgi:transcriptional regulator with XRE-family HTH domain
MPIVLPEGEVARPKSRFAAEQGSVHPTPTLALRTLVGQRLREAREAKGLSQVGVTRMGGPSASAVSAHEAGKQTPGLGVLEWYAGAYNRPVWWFLYETPPAGEGERYPLRDRWRGSTGERRMEPGSRPWEYVATAEDSP